MSELEKTRDHYSNGRKWSYIHKAWILDSSWNDKEEIAFLNAKMERLELKLLEQSR